MLFGFKKISVTLLLYYITANNYNTMKHSYNTAKSNLSAVVVFLIVGVILLAGAEAMEHLVGGCIFQPFLQ